jgi:hypothetical protein
MSRRLLVYVMVLFQPLVFACCPSPGLAAGAAAVTNPFLPLLTPAPTEAPPADATPDSVPESDIRLPSRLRLQGIIMSGARLAAIVGDRVVRRGDMLEGFEVTDIASDRVVFRRDDRLVELVLAPTVTAESHLVIRPVADVNGENSATDGAAR